MSTLQHTSQPAFRTRLALIVMAAGVVAVLVIALIASSGGSSNSLASPSAAQAHPTKAQLQQQLQAVAGARYRQPVGHQVQQP